jgi:holo-[acyl-carrier protein] synthase
MTARSASRGAALHVGIDRVEIHRIDRLAERFAGELPHVFTAAERDLARSSARPGRTLAVCFAAKEAVGKALGCGLAGIDWTDVEALPGRGRLDVTTTGRARSRAEGSGIRWWRASWTQERGAVTALVIGSGWDR